MSDRTVEKIVERRSIVLITEVPQRDEPPGRGSFRTEEIVLAQSERAVAHMRLPEVVADVVRSSD